MKLFDVVAANEPKWFQVRWLVSNVLVKVAKRVYPESPQVVAFFVKQMTDLATYGTAVSHVDFKEFNERLNGKEQSNEKD